MIKDIVYSFKQALAQMFGRNRGMTVASLFSITSMLFILGLFFFLSINISFLTESIKTQFDTIEVFLYDETSLEDAKVMMESLYSMDEVADVELITKEMAMREFKKRFGDNAYVLDGLAYNPLPNSLRVTLTSLEGGDMTAAICESFAGVEDVRFYKSEIEKIISISDAVKQGALVVIAFLICVSIIVVSSTIKITVMARHKEISIMKNVGATNWFIRGPLLTEGCILGILSAGIALGLCSALYIKINETMGMQAQALFSAALVEPEFLIRNLAWIFVALGVSIGTCGSIISMRRFLNTKD